MPGAIPLSLPVTVEQNGILYVVGVRGGSYYVRRSADQGQSWLPFRDGSFEREIAPATGDERAALVKLKAQGNPLLVGIPAWPNVVFYTSLDDGETWTQDSEV